MNYPVNVSKNVAF